MFESTEYSQKSLELRKQGLGVLNAYLFGPDERSHVDQLLEMMAPPQGARVLDAGCGLGEVAKLMLDARPDLQFTLQNISADQLAHCPPGMPTVHGDFADTGLPDESFDAVMFNYSICHAADWDAALREAARLLVDGGVLLINDHERLRGDNTLMAHMLRAMAFSAEQVDDAARRAGFELDVLHRPEPHERRLHQLLGGGELADLLTGDLGPAVWRFRRRRDMTPFDRHRRIGFQLSGGRDSVAALYTLREHWDKMTVYHLDTGDQYPELRAVVNQIRRDVPIEVIKSDSKGFRDNVAWPADVVPVDNTPMGRRISGQQQALVSRYECCWNNLMKPMHERMLADGITLIVRGQRNEDYANPPRRSGDVDGAMEVLYPIETWTTAEVDAYIAKNKLPNAAYYAYGAAHGPECMGCTAWMDDQRINFLERVYPARLEELRKKQAVIRSLVDRQLAIDGRAPQKEGE